MNENASQLDPTRTRRPAQPNAPNQDRLLSYAPSRLLIPAMVSTAFRQPHSGACRCPVRELSAQLGTAHQRQRPSYLFPGSPRAPAAAGGSVATEAAFFAGASHGPASSCAGFAVFL